MDKNSKGLIGTNYCYKVKFQDEYLIISNKKFSYYEIGFLDNLLKSKDYDNYLIAKAIIDGIKNY